MSTEFGILGELRVARDDHVLDPGSPRQQALLARLLIARSPVSADRLIDDLWATDAPETARHALHVYVSRLRKALGPDGDRLERHGSSYRFRFEPTELDGARFELAVNEGRENRARGDSEASSACLSEALEMWRGPALADFADEPWARDEAARLEEVRLTALEDRVWADLERGSASELVDELEGLVAEHPFREVCAEQLMLALYRSGRQAEALRAYQSQRRRLSEELGIDPGPALERMQERILVQDAALDLGAANPAPKIGASLPVQRTSFIGREREVNEASRLLVRCRLLTLTGPPGTGKTRLGLHLAEDADGFPDGKAFVPLAPVTDPDLLASAIASALGLREAVDEPAFDVVRAHLEQKRVLLLIDNLEHLLEAAPQVGELLDAAPDLKVVATSRAPLGIAGEQEYAVPPLEVPPESELDAARLGTYDAAALFVARARATDPGFEVDDVGASAIAALTRRLDGLPLAIELAAARVRLFVPVDLLERLERRFDVLATGPADAEERHRTLRGAVAWSHDLLTADEQVLFRRLGVFRGGFTLAAAAEVGDRTADTTEAGVESLLAQSLLYRPVSAGKARYAMLETMRAFALERLAAAGEEADAADRHAAYFTSLASELEPDLTGDDPGTVVDQLAAETDNLRAAFDHTLATGAADTGLTLASTIWRFWQSTGQLQEGRSWLDRVLELEGGSAEARAGGLVARAGLSYWLGDFEAARADYIEAHGLYLAADDWLGAADALYCLSLVASFFHDANEAELLAQEARSVYEEIGTDVQIGQALMAEATAAWIQGDLERARQLQEEGLLIHRRLQDHALVASQLVGLAGIDFHLERLDEAISEVAQALDLALETGNEHTQLFALDGLASFVAARQPEEAVRLAGATSALREAHGGGWTLEPFGVENARTATAGSLADEDIKRAWAEGSEMSLDEAVSLGRRLLVETAASDPPGLA